jgi:hypothetical protein
MRPNPEHFQIIFWHRPFSFGISAVMKLKGLTSTEPGAEGTLTCKAIHLPFQDSIDPGLDAKFKNWQPRPQTKAARELFLKNEIFKETFKLLDRDERPAGLKMFEIEFSAAFGKTPWLCNIEDVDALGKARRAAMKRIGSPHLYLLTALWDGVFSHMKSDREREEWLADHWQLNFPDGEAIRKQINKLKLPRSAGAYGVSLRKEEIS